MILHDLHPAWKVCIGLAAVIFITIATGSRVLIMQQSTIDDQQVTINDNARLLQEIREQQVRGEERGYINRAISGCADIINDGEIEITTECLDPRVAAYFPPSICEKLPIIVANCGENAVVITEAGGP